MELRRDNLDFIFIPILDFSWTSLSALSSLSAAEAGFQRKLRGHQVCRSRVVLRSKEQSHPKSGQVFRPRERFVVGNSGDRGRFAQSGEFLVPNHGMSCGEGPQSR